MHATTNVHRTLSATISLTVMDISVSVTSATLMLTEPVSYKIHVNVTIPALLDNNVPWTAER